MLDFVSIAYSWHGGQWSNLYKFACNDGEIFNKNHQDGLLFEISDCISSVERRLKLEYTSIDEKDLNDLHEFEEYVKEWPES